VGGVYNAPPYLGIMLDTLLKLPPDQLKRVIANIKEYKKNTEAFNAKPELYKEHSKDLKKEDGWTKDRTMKKTFSVPMNVYMSNPEYWDKVCKSRKLQKDHPEWQVGKSKKTIFTI